MCEVYSGHICIEKKSKSWGEVFFLSGIHHEKDREKIYQKYGQLKLAAWETVDYLDFRAGVKITTTEGDISPAEREEYQKMILSWAERQNPIEMLMHIISITKDGQPIAPEKIKIDVEGKTIAVEADSNVVFDCVTLKGFTFKTGSDCVVIRRGIFEIIEIPKGKTIKLNPYKEKGYKEVINAS